MLCVCECRTGSASQYRSRPLLFLQPGPAWMMVRRCCFMVMIYLTFIYTSSFPVMLGSSPDPSYGEILQSKFRKPRDIEAFCGRTSLYESVLNRSPF